MVISKSSIREPKGSRSHEGQNMAVRKRTTASKPSKATAHGTEKRAVATTPHSPLPTHYSPVVPLYPYQQRWLADHSRFKLAVKATQTGFSFAAALEAVLDCLEHRTLWIVLSRGERQSLEFMQRVLLHIEALRIAAGALETSSFEKTEVRALALKFPNGSRIIGLPANADTARGYTGNMILDEFAFHQADREIWAAAFGRVSRGDLKLRVLSTPNGQRGKFYELAKEAGLTAVSSEWRVASGETRSDSQSTHYSPLTTHRSPWSGHWCDVYTAVAEG